MVAAGGLDEAADLPPFTSKDANEERGAPRSRLSGEEDPVAPGPKRVRRSCGRRWGKAPEASAVRPLGSSIDAIPDLCR